MPIHAELVHECFCNFRREHFSSTRMRVKKLRNYSLSTTRGCPPLPGRANVKKRGRGCVCVCVGGGGGIVTVTRGPTTFFRMDRSPREHSFPCPLAYWKMLTVQNPPHCGYYKSLSHSLPNTQTRASELGLHPSPPARRTINLRQEMSRENIKK